MLSKERRLRRTRDIERARSVGRSLGNKALHVRFAPNGLANSRATVVISQRTAKRAVDRNRLKRQTRAAIAPQLKKLKPALDLVIILHRSALDMSYAELKDALARITQDIARRSQKR